MTNFLLVTRASHFLFRGHYRVILFPPSNARARTPRLYVMMSRAARHDNDAAPHDYEHHI